MATSKLPKIIADSAAIVDTPVAGDTALATGVLTLKNEAGGEALNVKISDIVGWAYDAYSAGTANENELDFTGATLLANTLYSISIKLPYTVAFFNGGAHATAGTRETEAVYTTRTYKVSTDATPTATELAAAFATRINADLDACFTASDAAGVLTITADSADSGAFIVDVSNIAGTTVTDSTPWVSPVGTITEAQGQVNADLVIAAGYSRYIIDYRKPIRHNAVKGNEVIKPAKFIYYIDKDDAGAGAAVTLLTSILDGSYATVADYLGAPQV